MSTVRLVPQSYPSGRGTVPVVQINTVVGSSIVSGSIPSRAYATDVRGETYLSQADGNVHQRARQLCKERRLGSYRDETVAPHRTIPVPA
jgi:hypothetical protein